MKKSEAGLGIIALLGIGFVAYKLFSGGGNAGGSAGGGGGGIFDFFDLAPSETTPSSEQGGNSEAVPFTSYLDDVLRQLEDSGKAFISPALPSYSGGIYPALDVNEQGLYVNRETGYVYPVDPNTGRQRARTENGEVVGRYIANEQGIPYGTYSYQTIPSSGIKTTYSEDEFGIKGASEAERTVTSKPLYGITKESTGGMAESVLITSKATGITQAAIVGTNPSTGQSYTWYGY